MDHPTCDCQHCWPSRSYNITPYSSTTNNPSNYQQHNEHDHGFNYSNLRHQSHDHQAASSSNTWHSPSAVPPYPTPGSSHTQQYPYPPIPIHHPSQRASQHSPQPHITYSPPPRILSDPTLFTPHSSPFAFRTEHSSNPSFHSAPILSHNNSSYPNQQYQQHYASTSSASVSPSPSNAIIPGSPSLSPSNTPKHKTRKTWSDEEWRKLVDLAEQSKKGDPNSDIDWDFVVLGFGGKRARQGILTVASKRGLKVSTRECRRMASAEGGKDDP